ncbi:MAG: hypothetical protein ACREMQ_11940 [Longimicrobiales bacterium]
MDDSTLVVETFSDSTRAQVTGSSRVELRDGRVLGRGENSSYVMTELDAEHTLFDPHEGVTRQLRMATRRFARRLDRNDPLD